MICLKTMLFKRACKDKMLRVDIKQLVTVFDGLVNGLCGDLI